MSATLTVNLARPIAALRIVEAADVNGAARNDENPDGGANGWETPCESSEPLADAQMNEQCREDMAQSCQLIETIAGKLNDLYDQAVVQHRADIAKLAVEIARKVLADRVGRNDYDVQSVIEEALKCAPTRQELTIRVNPADLPQCQQLQRDNPDGHFAELTFAADWSIDRADCMIETPKGIVKSFVEDHLARIAEALERAQQS